MNLKYFISKTVRKFESDKIRLFVFVLLLFPLLPGKSQEVNHWETIVMSDDIWKYFIGTVEPPLKWADMDFDDSGWLSGKGGIGYGDGDDSTVISPAGSVYMRIKFTVHNLNAIAEAILCVDFDDGFVAYLNGHEIARENIGTPGIRPQYNEYAILNTYEARMPAGGNPLKYYLSNSTLFNYLQAGDNILALQVHNCNETSSDLSSTTFLIFGIKNDQKLYRATPVWFIEPRHELTHLPVVVIDTKNQTIPDEPKIIVNLKIVNNGPDQLNSWYQPGTDFEGQAGIEIRGKSSQMFSKKSYAIELKDASGNDISLPLLGMPSEEDWVLHAHYTDKTMIRNALTFYLGSKLGGWQPRFRYCVVYLNGQYNGIYLLMENIKRDKERLDISRLNSNDISGDELTGGYIIKIDKLGGLTTNDYFTSYPNIKFPNTRNYKFIYVYPKPDSIASQQKEYIKKFVTEFENTLNGDDFRDPYTGYRKFIDQASFIDFQIIQELTNNVDGYRYSTYFYKKKETKGGKLYAGPLWDFDLCYGNVNYSDFNLSTSGWLYSHYGISEVYPMHWWARLMEDPGYARMFIFRWRELRKTHFSSINIMNFIDSISGYLGTEIERNYNRWPILGKYVWPNYFVGQTYAEEINYLKEWINGRLAWIDMETNTDSNLFIETIESKFIIFPNPFVDKIAIIFLLNSTLPVNIEIFDISGRKEQFSNYIPQKSGVQQIETDLSWLKTGVYFIMIRQNTRIIGSKIILKK